MTRLPAFATARLGLVVGLVAALAVGLRRALDLLERLAREWGRETGLALEDPQAQGIVRFGDGELGLRLMVKVPADKRAEAEMELRRRIKETFDREGIQVPSAERVVYLRAEKPGRDP